MSIAINPIKDFSEAAKTNAELKDKLKACERAKELVALAKEYGFQFDEGNLYPPNEPQFVEEQLHPKLVKALLR